MDIHTAKEFISNYADESRERIAFAWNGEHADEFEDANASFRAQIITYVLENPGVAPVILIRDLFLIEAEWSHEAWCVSNAFAQLGEMLLTRSVDEYLDDFLQGYRATFDTFSACHAIQLDPIILEALIKAINTRLATECDEENRKLLSAGKELFAKIRAGTAAEGLVVLTADTRVTNIRIVKSPGSIWERIKGFFRRR
ncbi:MAG: hypothetical protein BWY76_00576 [bacterium ADurb.Bin429]|nr:MAG: hypothetical protein BWY76_00576 [bacterium ADurb.Bin429]